jgi:hypothetical protein
MSPKRKIKNSGLHRMSFQEILLNYFKQIASTEAILQEKIHEFIKDLA